jgi:hypothetical protein
VKVAWIRTPWPTFLADFNAVGEDGRLFSPRSLFFASMSDFQIGAPAVVMDNEGNSVLAFIQAIQDRYVTLNPAWETWTGASPFQLTERGQSSAPTTLAGNTSYARVA